MKQDAKNGMKRISVNKNLTVLFVMTKKFGMMVNAGVNANN